MIYFFFIFSIILIIVVWGGHIYFLYKSGYIEDKLDELYEDEEDFFNHIL